MSTRERILTAAAEVMRTKGLARSTTKEIARASGFSEATLYKHFANQEELFLAVLGERRKKPRPRRLPPAGFGARFHDRPVPVDR